MAVTSTKTYLQIVNDAVQEAGLDLASFASDGSDFTTNTNAMLNRIKGWVSRAWKDIQQEAYDWDFMSEEGMVNLDPGFMFYGNTGVTIASAMIQMPNGTVFNILDQNGTIAVPNLKVNYIQDLTGVVTKNTPFGAMTLLNDGNTLPPLNVAWKAGEYFTVPIVTSVTATPASWFSYDFLPPPGVSRTYPFPSDAPTGIGALGYVNPDTTLATLLYTNSAHQQPTTYNIPTNSVSFGTANAITLAVDSNLSNVLYANSPTAITSMLLRYQWSCQLVVTAGTATSINLPLVLSGNQSAITSFNIAQGASYDGKDLYSLINRTWFRSGQFKISSLDGTRYLTFNPNGLLNVSGSIVGYKVQNGAASSTTPFTTEGEVVNLTYIANFQGSTVTVATATSISTNFYVSGWKSFDLVQGETQSGDFVENVQEIKESSFRLVDYYSGPPLSEVPLTYVPWEVFRTQYDLAGGHPGLPRVVTKDSTGRYKLYPPPYYRVTLKFDYNRTPQTLVNYNDTVVGLSDDFVDIIMWRAVMYYGEYDEQPSIVARATKNYKERLFRLELKNRAKFHFLPHRMW